MTCTLLRISGLFYTAQCMVYIIYVMVLVNLSSQIGVDALMKCLIMGLLPARINKTATATKEMYRIVYPCQSLLVAISPCS